MVFQQSCNCTCRGGITNRDSRYIYTNSKEAIISHYETGFRLFEVDLDFTVYLTPVLCHDWNIFCSMTGLTSTDVTLEQFKNAIIYDLYTPTTLEDLVELMIQYDDMYIDIDSKERSPSVWIPALVSYCELNDALDVLDRIIVEFYNEENYEEIDSLYHFKNYFYTDYLLNSGNALTEEQHQSVIEFLIRKNIPYYETNDSNITKALVSLYHSYGIKVVTWGSKSHSVSDFKTLKEIGVDAIQSDWVTNDMWNEN